MIPIMADKWVCLECRFIGALVDFDLVKDPRGPDSWTVCPKCRAPDRVTSACDEPGCDREGTCGFRTETRYRRTCFKHSVFQRPKPLQAGPPT
jgi:hypothetical protein